MPIRRCYILGAGFSKPFGLPLARELTQQVVEHIAAKNDRELGRHMEPTVAAWTGFLKKLYPDADFANKWPDFEDLITVLDEWELYRADYQGTPTPDDTMQPAHIKHVLLKHLGLTLCQAVANCTGAVLEPVRRFVLAAMETGDSVISFNWDLLLEVAAAELGVPVSYGGVVNEGLQIAKPHGSLNLAEVDKHTYEPSFTIRNLSIDFSVESRVVLRANDPRDAADRIVHPFKDALLVEPSTRKSYKAPWLILQWKRAFEMVRHADEIVVIGFSLPPNDIRPRVLLQLAGFDRTPRPRIVIVSPNATELLDRYRSVAELDVQPVVGGLDQWLRVRSAEGHRTA